MARRHWDMSRHVNMASISSAPDRLRSWPRSALAIECSDSADNGPCGTSSLPVSINLLFPLPLTVCVSTASSLDARHCLQDYRRLRAVVEAWSLLGGPSVGGCVCLSGWLCVPQWVAVCASVGGCVCLSGWLCVPGLRAVVPTGHGSHGGLALAS
jgi:hypothetical protein